ncbi:hypothetical protein, variant 1 [Aphanomyces invadans]|uniref:C2 domain-containing protein n=1 Tax=Aphanomyces invadans TaxID=157072 RepID=A0A024TTG1_9STRA|nr:hypothetical protein, variant 1 [Aphanomyces invadans]ETV97415.1 hypothetical protein, variant 1 [Aphanomyces invadans]|eukprot:XP_008874124.1 hypothetical protein, variant 1 [Aphanomyces invadans]
MAATEERQLRMLTRGITRDCIEEGVLEPSIVAKEDMSATYAYSAEFVKTLDNAIRANFGTSLWHDILASQNVPKYAMSWPSHGWSDALHCGGFVSPASTLSVNTKNAHIAESCPRDYSLHDSVDTFPPPISDTTPQTDLTHSAASEGCTIHVDEASLGNFDECPTLVPLDAMLKVMRLAQTIQRAARKFKSLLRNSKHPRPMYIHLLHGDNLRAADWNGASDPYVVVTVLESSNPRNLEAAQTTKSDIVYKTLNPHWDQRLLLPAVAPSATLCLTVLDYDFGSNPDFLGQVMIPVQSVTTVTKVNLGPLMFTPRHPDGSIMAVSDKSKPGQGSITFALERCPNVVILDDLDVLAPADPKKWFQAAPTAFHTVTATLMTDAIVLYSPNDKAECKPTATIPFNSIAQILDDGDTWTLRLNGTSSEWKFRVGLDNMSREAMHDRWLKALCRTTKRPVLVEASPSQFQIKFQPLVVA